jgi:regulator of protease activity HflC (stomatin/prohibitin superfamily)
MLVLLVLMFVVAALASRIFITVPSGHGGILWMRFFGGTQTQSTALGEGLHIIFPWDHIFIYDMRVQEHEQTYQVITKDGLQVSVKCSFRWQLNRSTLGRLHKDIGPNYMNVLLVPEVGSVSRERISQYNVEQLFSSHRTQVQNEIFQAVIAENPGQSVNRIGSKDTIFPTDDYITLTDILLKDVTLPFLLRSAIERKLEQAQISQEYAFRIQRERLESERKQIEAQGIQAFQQTVQTGISDAYLKWRGIEATLQLATSPNSKVVIVGGGSQGLPLILNTDDSAPRHAPPAAAAEPAHPAKVQKADAEQGGKLAGSIDMTPASTNTSIDRLINPQAAADSEEEGAPPPAAPGQFSTQLNQPESSDAPPYILRSFADAFGYRLQPIVPGAAASIEIGPNERPR